MTTQTVHQTRRERLELLIAEHRSIAALNTAMGMRREDATFSLIRNQSEHSSTKKPRVMGDELARKVEATLGLPVGWMDTPLSRVDARIEHVVEILQNMSEPLRDQAVAVVDALAAAVPPHQAPKAQQDTPSPAPSAAPAPRHDKDSRDGHGSSEAHADRHASAVADPVR